MTTMVCRTCGEKAVIRMRQHRLAFCQEHYQAWFIEQTQRTIEKYHMFVKGERILVAVSGGKDSLALWDVLWKLGYQADGLYLNLGIESEEHYSAESYRYTRDFAEQRGLSLHVVNIEENYGKTIPALARMSRRGRNKPCAVCGLTKRHELNRIAHEQGYGVLVTGHNLDDEVATLFANTLTWQVSQLVRQAPVLEASEGLARKAKPFCRFYERETAAYTLLSGIEYIEEECPHAEGSKQLAYKELLNKLEEEHPGLKLNFYVSFLNAKDQGTFNPALSPRVQELTLSACPNCGQPTTHEGECAFCRVISASQAAD